MASTAYSDLNGYGSRRERRRARRANRTRTGKLSRFISIGGLLLTVGTALYRFRKQWVPKVEEVADDLRAKVEQGDLHASAMPKRSDTSGAGAHMH